MIHRKKMSYLLITSLFLSTALDAESTIKLDPVIVTAQKSEENVQNVPISISVFDEISLEDKSIDTLDDIGRHTPNLLLFDTGQQGMTSPSIRGISANVLSYSTPVSLYIDGVPTLSSFGFENALGDIERVEVLRGPQGTLYGKNSEVGVINIISRKPDNRTKGKISTRIGSDGKKELAINASGAIIKDTLYMGASFISNEKDGFIKNSITNKNINHKKNKFGKINIRYTPTENLDISFIASRSKNNNGAHDWARAKEGIPLVASNLESSLNTTTDSLALSVEYKIDDDSTVKSITTVRKHKDKSVIDADFSPKTFRHLFKDHEFNSASQELRYETKISNAKIVAGIFLDKEDNDLYFKVHSPKDPTGSRAKPQNLTSDSIGVFGNVIYSLSDKWTLNTGIRYDRENKELSVSKTPISIDKSWDNISPKLSIQYAIDKDSMSYFTVAKGYRAGGFNPFAPKNKKSYDEESLISYELGYKGIFLNDSIRFNANMYYMDIDNMQVEESPKPGIVYIVSAASATSKGFEFEFEALLNNEFTLFTSAGFSDTTFDNFFDDVGDYSGNTSPRSPKYNFNMGAQYRSSTGFYARIDLNGYGKIYFDKANKNYQDAYNLVDTKIGYETSNFDIYLYANNLFDKKHDAVGGFFNGFVTVYREDREIGLKLAYRF